MYGSLIGKYARKGLLIDTNILLLYVVGSYDKEIIPRFKRTDKFLIEDFNLLLKFINLFERIVTTPNILTEVYNLAGQLGEPSKSKCLVMLASLIPSIEEHYIESHLLAKESGFVKYGLTDLGIYNFTKEAYLVLTDDFRLSQFLENEGLDVINFNHIRTIGWT